MNENVQKLGHLYKVMNTPCTKPYAIFFDDASHHFTNDCGAVFGLKVSSGRNGIGKRPALNDEAEDLWQKNQFHKMYDSKSGVKIKTFHSLCKICSLSEVKCVIFDWDKTLSVHAGVDTSVKPSYRAAECYFGGEKRMKSMRRFFRMAFWKRWNVRIMTSNPVAKENASYFRRILSTVWGRWIPIEYVPYPKIKHLASRDEKYGLQCNACGA